MTSANVIICDKNNFFYEKIYFSTLFFAVLVFAFSPPASFVVSIFILIFICPVLNDKHKQLLSMVLVYILAAFCLSIANASEAIIYYAESDFTTYYNNYLFFLENGFAVSGFEFGGGAEVGIPLLNYLFSLIIGEPLPYMIKFLYSMGQFSLILLLCFKIQKRHIVSTCELCFLVALILIFVKLGALQNHLRQGFSSLFILLFIFSDKKYKVRYAYFLLATAFHLSAIIILPLVSCILSFERAKMQRFIMWGALLFGGGIYAAFSFIEAYASFFTGPFWGKLIWSVLKFQDKTYVVNSILTNAQVSFFLLLNVALLLFIKGDNAAVIRRSITLSLVIIFSFCYLPGVSRVVSPIYLILTGYYYFLTFRLFFSISTMRIVTLLICCLMQVNWFLSPLYYRDIELFDTTPFYYVEKLFYTQGFKARTYLPSREELIGH